MKKMAKLVIALSLVGSSVLNFPVSSFAETAGATSSSSQTSALQSIFTKTLWDTPQGNIFYRIPAITTTNAGDVIAVTDARYNHANDLGNHKIDLLIKTSGDNGDNWSPETNLTATLSRANYGYGDAAIVSDRNSDKVLIVNAVGSASFWNSTRSNKLGVTTMVSDNGGKTFSSPVVITDQIYNLDQSWQGLFVAAGRIMQSRYVKVGEYNRLYMAILARNAQNAFTNHVLYSDDFGKTWKLLGSNKSPVPGGDEAKLEELPNGNVVISSRVSAGRYINIFKYNENDYSSGTWEDSHQFLKYSDIEGQPTNGEILVVYAKEKETGEYKHLVLQTLPTGTKRTDVKIFYRELDENVSTVQEYIDGWDIENNYYMLQSGGSVYSTMTIQRDGTLGFLYETNWYNDGQDIVYKRLSLETITNGKYQHAFTGIGSEKTPYVITTKEQLAAKDNVFANEDVHWVLEGEAANIVGSLNKVSNGDFENNDLSNEDTWRIKDGIEPDSGIVQADDNHYGTINSNVTDGFILQKIPTTPGKTYTLEADVFVDSSTEVEGVYLTAKAVTATGEQGAVLKQLADADFTKGTWERKSFEFTASSAETHVGIVKWSGQVNEHVLNSTIAFDNISVRENKMTIRETAPEESDQEGLNKVSNGDFEDADLTNETAWEMKDGIEPDSGIVQADGNHYGTLHSNVAEGFILQKIPTTPGKTYTLEADVFVDSATVVEGVYLTAKAATATGEQGAILKQLADADFTKGTWERKSFEFTASSAETHVGVVKWSDHANENVMNSIISFDNISVRENQE